MLMFLAFFEFSALTQTPVEVEFFTINHLFSSQCKLAVLHGTRLHKLALHYSRAAEPSHPGTRFPELSVRTTECRPRAQQGLGARSARGRR